MKSVDEQVMAFASLRCMFEENSAPGNVNVSGMLVYLKPNTEPFKYVPPWAKTVVDTVTLQLVKFVQFNKTDREVHWKCLVCRNISIYPADEQHPVCLDCQPKTVTD